MKLLIACSGIDCQQMKLIDYEDMAPEKIHSMDQGSAEKMLSSFDSAVIKN